MLINCIIPICEKDMLRFPLPRASKKTCKDTYFLLFG